jgi:PiT family inorganic phosphate transporter
MLTLLIVVVVVAIIFDFINGFHDAANSIATVVSTQVLSPVAAVIWAAFFNVVAFWIFKLHVADTVAKTVSGDVTLYVVLAGLIAATVWNLITWWLGIPSSSSHTLIGGFAGAAIAHGGWDVIGWYKAGKEGAAWYDGGMPSGVFVVFAFIVVAPFIGMFLSYIISVITLHICKNSAPAKIDKIFRRLQLVSSAAFSLGHGGNDAQKVMGIISAALIVYMKYLQELNLPIPDWANVIQETDIATGKTSIKHIPAWVEISCYTAIGMGTMMGGWKIVKTMGSKITKLTPFEGFAAETAGAVTLFGTSSLGIPVSTTHTITGSIIGVGMLKRISAVRWGVTISLLWAWVLTIPVTGAIAALIYFFINDVLGLK